MMTINSTALAGTKNSKQAITVRTKYYHNTDLCCAFCALSRGVSVQTLVSPRPSLPFILNDVVECIGTPAYVKKNNLFIHVM